MRTCIITGAGMGIGRATALELAKNSDIKYFVLISLGIAELKETMEEMKKIADRPIEVSLYDQDITKYDEVADIVEAAYQTYGRIDVLLNIAGFAQACSFLEMPRDLLENTFKVNVFAMFMNTQTAAKYMKKQGGVIVNVASTSGSTPRPGWSAYASSKSAVIGFSRTLTYELAEFGIKVFNVSPGRCATAMRKSLKPTEDETSIMQPEVVGRVIADLVNNPENCIDGQDIIVRKLN